MGNLHNLLAGNKHGTKPNWTQLTFPCSPDFHSAGSQLVWELANLLSDNNNSSSSSMTGTIKHKQRLWLRYAWPMNKKASFLRLCLWVCPGSQEVCLSAEKKKGTGNCQLSSFAKWSQNKCLHVTPHGNRDLIEPHSLTPHWNGVFKPYPNLNTPLNKGRAICQACLGFMFVMFVSFVQLCKRLGPHL